MPRRPVSPGTPALTHGSEPRQGGLFPVEDSLADAPEEPFHSVGHVVHLVLPLRQLNAPGVQAQRRQQGCHLRLHARLAVDPF